VEEPSSVWRDKDRRTNGRNPLRRLREVLWAVGSHGGAGRLQYKLGGGSKLRRGGAVDLNHEGRWIRVHIGESGFL
jgi:hypothetical protein